jgi:hypothetical protein
VSSSLNSEIRSFFSRFEQAGNDGDSEALGSLFCDTFMNLDPNSAAPVPREALLATLPVRRKLFGSIGIQGTDLETLTETPLDDHHVMVETTWRTRFTETAPSQDPLTLHSTFLLHREGGEWRIAVYLNHQDIMAIIRERSGEPHGARD